MDCVKSTRLLQFFEDERDGLIVRALWQIVVVGCASLRSLRILGYSLTQQVFQPCCKHMHVWGHCRRGQCLGSLLDIFAKQTKGRHMKLRYKRCTLATDRDTVMIRVCI